MCGAEPDVVEAEVFAAASRSLLARLNYTSHIPCNGVEEPKSTESARARRSSSCSGGPRALSSGSAPSPETSVQRVSAGPSPGRAGPPWPIRTFSPPPPGRDRVDVPHPTADPQLFALSDEQLVEAGWRVVDAGLRAFLASSRLADLAGDEAGLRRLGLILGGDVGIVQDRVAIASTQCRIPGPMSRRRSRLR